MSSYFDSCFAEFDLVLVATSAISQNGDDAIELFYNGNVIETLVTLMWMDLEQHGNIQTHGHIKIQVEL